MRQRTACVLGAGGFIGSHMVKRLKMEGYWVRAVDLKHTEFAPSPADEFIIADLRSKRAVSQVLFAPDQSAVAKDDVNSFDEVYQFAACMGGAGFVFTGDNDAEIMHSSALINLNVAHYASLFGVKKLFYSSSACIYPQQIQGETDNPGLHESDAYPVNPDSEYGWEKIFSERLYQSYHRNHGLNIRIARFHNIFGIEGCWRYLKG
jgi:nucleoside-diphosphate-sugar epimerase